MRHQYPWFPLPHQRLQAKRARSLSGCATSGSCAGEPRYPGAPWGRSNLVNQRGEPPCLSASSSPSASSCSRWPYSPQDCRASHRRRSTAASAAEHEQPAMPPVLSVVGYRSRFEVPAEQRIRALPRAGRPGRRSAEARASIRTPPARAFPSYASSDDQPVSGAGFSSRFASARPSI